MLPVKLFLRRKANNPELSPWPLPLPVGTTTLNLLPLDPTLIKYEPDILNVLINDIDETISCDETTECLFLNLFLPPSGLFFSQSSTHPMVFADGVKSEV